MESYTIEAPWSSLFTWEDLSTLAVCLTLDLLDFLVPFMSSPIFGDVLDFAGIAFCLIFFSWMGVISILEIIPGLDILPLFTITWLVWYLHISRERRKRICEELEQWK